MGEGEMLLTLYFKHPRHPHPPRNATHTHLFCAVHYINMTSSIQTTIYHDGCWYQENGWKAWSHHAARKRPPNLVWLWENQTSTNSSNTCNKQETNKKQLSIHYTRYVRSTLTLGYLLLYLVHSGRAQRFFIMMMKADKQDSLNAAGSSLKCQKRYT
jgi:hypothetical protein